MKAKKLFSVVSMILTLVLCLTACGADADVNSNGESGTPETEYQDTITIDLNSEISYVAPSPKHL